MLKTYLELHPNQNYPQILFFRAHFSPHSSYKKSHQQCFHKKAQLTRDSAVIPRWPPDAILDFIEPQIAPFDPPIPKTLA